MSNPHLKHSQLALSNVKGQLSKWPKVLPLDDEFGFQIKGSYKSPSAGKATKKLNLILTQHDIGIGKRISYEVIERQQLLEFTIEQHQKAQQEQEKEIQSPRKKSNQTRLYRNSLEVVIRHGARRIVIAEIFDNHLLAEQLHGTLVILDNVLNDYRRA